MKEFSEPVICEKCGPGVMVSICWVRCGFYLPQISDPKFLNHTELQPGEEFVGIVCHKCRTVWAEGATDNFRVWLVEETAGAHCEGCGDFRPAPIPYHDFVRTCIEDTDWMEEDDMDDDDSNLREEFEEEIGLSSLTPKQQNLIGRIIDRIFNCDNGSDDGPCRKCEGRFARIYELVKRFTALKG